MTVNHTVIGKRQNSSVGLECLIENHKVDGSNPSFDTFTD